MEKNLSLLKNAMAAVERSGSFEPLFDLFADQIMFEATIREGTPISGQFIGKAAVLHYFTDLLPSVAQFVQQQPMEFIVHEDRIIILGDDAYTLTRNNKTFRSPYAMVLTYQGILIAKILIIQDLSGIYEAYVTATE